ncbi:hypothetical protein AC579_290 [Pseudocercospora musae]|uniref:Uncharacterized protein n=1 Tax=Pseudocercospora musae TaxID=113226 RepID=A0A139I9A2_9PEZI|nr:hypothetical protein AC579_290 [Pseudocercospora musae]
MSAYESAMDLSNDPTPLTQTDMGETIEAAAVTPPPAHIQTPTSATLGRCETRPASLTPTPIAPPINTQQEQESLARAVHLATCDPKTIPADTPLRDLPELADRYVPLTSADLGVEYRNPRKFCLKPPCWQKWTPREYQEFGKWLGTVELTDIARKLNKPVQEVGCMLDNVAVVPLQDAAEASRRGVEGMMRWFERYGKYGTPTREWTGQQVRGELEKVSHDKIYLIVEKNGNRLELAREHLTNDDITWLKQNLITADKKLFFDGQTQEQSEPEVPQDDLREWGNDKILAAFAGVSKLKVHLVRPDGSRTELDRGLLCTADSAWMREKGEDGVPKVSVLSRRMISNTNVSEDEYEKNAVTLVRTWTKDGIIGNLYGVRTDVLTIIQGDGNRKEIPRGELTREDVMWLKNNISMRMRKELSGKARQQEQARSVVDGMAQNDRSE